MNWTKHISWQVKHGADNFNAIYGELPREMHISQAAYDAMKACYKRRTGIHTIMRLTHYFGVRIARIVPIIKHNEILFIGNTDRETLFYTS